jgi:hypothetical protein
LRGKPDPVWFSEVKTRPGLVSRTVDALKPGQEET